MHRGAVATARQPQVFCEEFERLIAGVRVHCRDGEVHLRYAEHD
jgi:hypothetical protein